MIDLNTLLTDLAPIDVQLVAPECTISDLLFDSRRLMLPEHTLFFAIATPKNDGHHYIDELATKGVRNFVITNSLSCYAHLPHCNFFQVKDCVAALQQMVIAHRKRFTLPVIGITGSNGKTIIKEWLTQMLEESTNLIANPNSYNSQIGVPCSVWGLQSMHQLAIFEAGISQPGEMQRLEPIIAPTIGILTNITSAHATFFASNQEKLNEKLQLFQHSKQIIYCCDDPLIAHTLDQNAYDHLEHLSWGHTTRARYRISQTEKSQHQTRITLDGESYHIPFIDAASVENATHCIVLLLFLHYTPQYINERLSLLTPVAMRMEVKEANDQSIVINDSYSLDFRSLRIALDFLNSQSHFTRRTVILSDFAQMGLLEQSDYQRVNQYLQGAGITKLIGVGEGLFQHQDLFDIADQQFFKSTAALVEAWDTLSFQREAILVKGARHFAFEKIVDLLQLKSHRTVLNVSIPALIHNLNYYRGKLAAGTKVVAMVKARCYGLGDAELISELQYHNIDYLAVAYTDEGVRLRKRGVKLPIIVLGAEVESFTMMLHYGLEPEIFNFYSLRELEQTLRHFPSLSTCPIHLKIDSGMHRLGFRKEDLPELIAILQRNPKMRVASLFSHLAAAEDSNEDIFTQSQIDYFAAMAQSLQQALGYPIIQHIANTAAITRFPQAHFDMVRIGIGLYGFSNVPEDLPHLQHVATLKTVITHTIHLEAGESVGYNRAFVAEKPTRIGIIPIGYADGYPPELSCGVGKVIVEQQSVPVVGKICMDMTMIDLTHVEAQEGDEVIIYGEENRIDTIAASIHKIPYHLLTAISRRVPRIFVMD